MTLAILGPRGIPARYGGFETFAEELSVRLVRRGVQVTVYCEAGAADEPAEFKGVKLIYMTCRNWGPLRTVLYDLRCLWHGRKDYCVVYMLGYGAAPFCFIPQIWASRVWLNVDGIEWARAKWGVIARTYFKLMEFFSTRVPDRVIADAQAIKSHLESRHGRLANCDVIPYGAAIVDKPPAIGFLSEWKLSPNGYYLVVARLEPENHILEIIEGYATADAAVPLVVVGNIDTSSGYVNRILSRAERTVRFIGGVYDRQKLEALRFHARAYVHGHSVGGTNPSLLEALGCGNIVIAHENVFNREALGDLGFYFHNASTLASVFNKIDGLSQDVRTKLSQEARGRIKERYNWDKIADRYFTLLRSDNS